MKKAYRSYNKTRRCGRACAPLSGRPRPSHGAATPAAWGRACVRLHPLRVLDRLVYGEDEAGGFGGCGQRIHLHHRRLPDARRKVVSDVLRPDVHTPPHASCNEGVGVSKGGGGGVTGTETRNGSRTGSNSTDVEVSRLHTVSDSNYQSID